MNRIITLFIYIMLVIGVSAQEQVLSLPQVQFGNEQYPKYEVRAVWLTTIGGIDWPRIKATNPTQRERQKQELINILDRLRDGGVNTVLLQARVRATTIYPSKYEPFDVCMTGKNGGDPGYDALQFAIEECHKRGMECHAWVCTIPVGKWNGAGCSQIKKKYPNLAIKVGDDGYLNPQDSRTPGVIAQVCEEIVRNYDVDGIHLDYIRYHENMKLTVSRDQARRNITNIVREVNHRVKAVKPWVKMSCSPVGKFDDLPRQSSKGWNAYTKVCQDAQGWLRDGLMDALFPMMYFQGENFYPFAFDWKENSYGKIVAPGLGIYFMDPKEKNWPLKTITSEMEMCRQWGMGHTYFRSMHFTDNMKGLYAFAAKQFDAYPAAIPAMTWASNKIPTAPNALVNDTVNNVIKWSGAKDNSDGDYLMYNVYSSNSWPVDVNDVKNLVAPRIRNTFVKVPLKGYRFYAVTAVDRYGNESKPLQNYNLPVPPQKPLDAEGLLKCDGKKVYVGDAAMAYNHSDRAVIASLQGNLIQPVGLGREIDVHKLPNGMYQLRSLNKKGISHRIGFFQIDRRYDAR